MKLKSGIFALITLAILASCSTSNDVISGRGIIQKRKYNDGFYIASGKKFNKNTTTDNKSDIVTADGLLENATFSENIDSEPIETIGQNPEIQTNNLNPVEAQDDFSEVVQNSETAEVNTTLVNNIENQKTTETNSDISISQNNVIKQKRTHTIPALSTKIKQGLNANSGGDVPFILLIILAFLLPWLAVGLYTNWDVLYTVLAVLLWFLAIVPGIIFALLVIFDVV